MFRTARHLLAVLLPVVCIAILALDGALAADDLPPWKTNPSIVEVQKEIHLKSPQPKAAALCFVAYVGPKGEMREIRGMEVVDDVHTGRTERFSMDHGQTWGEPQPLAQNDQYYEKVLVWEGQGHEPTFDPASGLLIDLWLRQIAHAGRYHQATYYRLSKDNGKTWSTPKQLKYEAGPDFDPKQPLAAEYLQKNQAYYGSSILRHSSGALVVPICAANAPDDPDNNKRAWRMGSLCFVGKWNPSREDYDWTAGKPVSVTTDVSARGLMEPDAAEISDGRVLVAWRTSSTAKTPGQKMFSISDDGGLTFSPPAEWKYDDGSRFYSPSSYHRFLRHSPSGKLYWVGNICPAPPAGNSPRHPLVIAEVDEKLGALKKKTVSLIDERRDNQPDAIQFSNFSLFENRQTHALQLYLSCYGEFTDSVYTANNYRYTVKLKK